jgi:ribonuclease I
MQCEWAKHGSCSDFATPEEYFAAQTRLADSLTLPEPQPGQSARAFATAIVAANTGRGLERRHLRVVGGGAAGIREVRICFERDLGRFRPC